MFAVFTDIDSFNVWIAKINEDLGFPNNTGTETYSLPVIHSDGSVIALIDDQIQFSGQTMNRIQAVEAGFIDERIYV